MLCVFESQSANQMNGSQHSQDRRNALNPPPVCFNCGVPGHFVVACPQPSREVPACNLTIQDNRGIGITHAQSLNSHSRQVHLQHRPYSFHQQTFYPNQPCVANIGATSCPIYNAASSPVLSYQQPTFQRNYYLAPQLIEPQHLPCSSYASQNYHYGPLSRQVSTSNYLYSTPNSSHQTSSPPTNYVNHPYHRSFASHSPSGHEPNHRAPFSNHKKKKSNATNIKYQQPNPRTLKFKKFKSPKLKGCSGAKANTSEDYKTISHQRLEIQNLTHKLQKDINNLESQHIGYLAKNNVNKENEDVDVEYTEVDPKEEIWEWEFSAIFKEPSAVEVVELAQPLAAGFKSTPVPLTQPWSSLVPSISRYARKDNAKEFARSIRCSPQWSYLQEDPAFTDIEVNSPLISLDEILTWIAMRREVYKNSCDTNKYCFSKTLCQKRERPDESETYSQQDVEFQNKVDTQCTIKEPSQKKPKRTSLGAQHNFDSLKTNSALPVFYIEENSHKEDILDKNMGETLKSRTTLSSRDASDKKQNACEVSIFAAYRSVFNIFTLSYFLSRLTTSYSRRW